MLQRNTWFCSMNEFIMHLTWIESPACASIWSFWCSNNCSSFEKDALSRAFFKITTNCVVNHFRFLETRLQALTFVLFGEVVIIMIFIVVIRIIMRRITKFTRSRDFCVRIGVPWKWNQHSRHASKLQFQYSYYISGFYKKFLTWTPFIPFPFHGFARNGIGFTPIWPWYCHGKYYHRCKHGELGHLIWK